MKYFIAFGTVEFQSNSAKDIEKQINERIGFKVVSINQIYNAMSRPGKSRLLSIRHLSHKSPAASAPSDPSHQHLFSSAPVD
jgi:hypothetical protein